MKTTNPNSNNTMSYSDYLKLDQLLSSQCPLSPNHHEMLFIIQHQTSELWFKLLLHELDAVRRQVIANDLPPAFKMLARIVRIMEQLTHAWSVLATMPPSEYSAIRPFLASSSGLQSYQYREFEFMLGNKNATLLKVHESNPEHHAKLTLALTSPSIYDETVILLTKHGFAIDTERLDADWTLPTKPNASVLNAWKKVYQAPDKYGVLYELAEKLVDLETTFRIWRYHHVTTVERLIGSKAGTGGTEGVSYLRKMLDAVLFPELFALRTEL